MTGQTDTPSAPPQGRQQQREITAMTMMALRHVAPGQAHRDNLVCPVNGVISQTRLPERQAQQLVDDANHERAERRGLQRIPYTSPVEVRLVAALLLYGCDTYVLQHPVDQYDCDVYFPSERLCVEVDGRDLHQPDLDERRDQHLDKHGISTLRLRAGHVNQDPLWAARQVFAAIADQRRRLTDGP